MTSSRQTVSERKVSQIHSHLFPNQIRPMDAFDVNDFEALQDIGIHIPQRTVRSMSIAFDALEQITPSITTPSINVPVQFLQNWLPGHVKMLTAARKIDELIGRTTIGKPSDEQIVQTFLELEGLPQPYGDYTNVPLSSWNTQFVTRTVVRFEEGFRVGFLETERTSAINIDNATERRNAAALVLEIMRNLVGFYGWNNGANNTYGFLNDPNLPNYNTVPNGASGSPHWSTKTFLEIQNDILTFAESIRIQSLDQVDPYTTPMTLALSTSVIGQLGKTSDFGISVRKWLTDTYPNIRVVSAPELTGANGGANVGYMYADRIQDLSTDGGATFLQNVPALFYMLGVAKDVKHYVEDYFNATSGVLLKRPFLVYRASGL